MKTLFLGKKKSNKLEEVTFENYLSTFDFESLFSKSKLQRNIATNLNSILYMRSDNYVLLKQNKLTTGKEKDMVISVDEAKIDENHAEISDFLKDRFVTETRLFSAFLGVAFYEGDMNLIFAKNLKLRFNLNGHEIFEVEKVTAMSIAKGEENEKFTKSLRKVS